MGGGGALFPSVAACALRIARLWHLPICAGLQAAGESLSWVAGDFFGAPEQLPQGDLFVLARILHDWDEERCRKLLQAVYELLPEGGWRHVWYVCVTYIVCVAN